MIAHRLFNPKEKYEPKLIKKVEENTEAKELALPKKTGQFLKYWKNQTDNL